MNNSLFRNATVYTISSILNAAIPFLLVPILTRYLSPDDYGMVSILGVAIAFISAIIGINADSAIARRYFDLEPSQLPVYISSSLAVFVVSAVGVTTACGALFPIISSAFNVRFEWVLIVLLICISQFICRITLVLWQVRGMALPYGVFQIGQTALNAGLTLALVVVFGMGWEGRMLGQAIAVVLFSIVGIATLYQKKWIVANIDWGACKDILSYGIPLIPHTLGGIIMTMTDRVFITSMVDLKQTGLYAAGYQIGMIIGVVSSAFNQAYSPWLFKKLSVAGVAEKCQLVKMTYVYFVVVIVTALLLSAFAPIVCKIFLGPEFQSSIIYIVWIALGFAFDAMYKMVVNYIFFANKTYILAGITFAVALLNVVLNYFFIKWNGAIGAAQATTLTLLVMFFSTWLLSNHAYRMPWFSFMNTDHAVK